MVKAAAADVGQLGDGPFNLTKKMIPVNQYLFAVNQESLDSLYYSPAFTIWTTGGVAKSL